MPYGVATASGLLSKTGRSLVSFLMLFSYRHLFMGLLHPSVLPGLHLSHAFLLEPSEFVG